MAKRKRRAQVSEYKKLLRQAAKSTEAVEVPMVDQERQKKQTEADVYLEGMSAFYHMRRQWSWILAGCMAFILVFDVVLVIGVGRGWFVFVDEWFLRLVLTTNLADIIGLIYLVVKFLFQHPPKVGENQTENNESRSVNKSPVNRT